MQQQLLWFIPLFSLSACAGQHHSSTDSSATLADSSSAVTSEVRDPSTVHTYVVNDYVDPNNPRVLHRGHVIDVVEQDEKWNLDPTAAPVTASGPTDTVPDPNAAPNPYSAEFETELAEQRNQYQQLAGLGAQMTAEMEKLQQIAQKNADAVSENAALRNRLNELQQEIDQLKPPPSAPITPNAPKKPSWLDSIWQLFRQLTNGTPVAQDKGDLHTNMVLRPMELPPTPPAQTNAPAAPPTNAPDSQPPDPSVPPPGELAQPVTGSTAQP